MGQVSLTIAKKFADFMDWVNPEQITHEYLKVWKSVPEVLNTIKVEDAIIDISWKDTPRLITNDVLPNAEQGKTQLAIDFTITFNDDTKTEDSRLHAAKHRVNNTLLHLFIIMNLTAPGSFCCYDYDLYRKDIDSISFLDPLALNDAWRFSLDNDLFDIKGLDLLQTLNWYQSLNIGYKQLSTNRIERAIFAILNYCTEQEISSPAGLVWLAHALESLYDSPRGSIAKTLLDRIILFLEIPAKQKSMVKEKITQFYKYRSDYVHGKGEIALPNANDLLDYNANTYYNDILDLSEFVLAIIIATFQKMIVNNWSEIRFTTIQQFEVGNI